MSDIAIKVENLGKLYRIGAQRQSYATLRETLVSGVKRILPGMNKTTQEENLWALKGVSFEVKHGEVMGIIGRNGAGKSTLLKVLAHITEPTEGRVTLNGRVGSLLEVGTGFHPELTGRENIYLNGAILGMKRADIQRKFDEIVDFAEIEKFLDTPVKHYSSGMYVRLAFAVAAHLEPEILVVDEVLAVGDAEFQKKCLGKMGDVAKSGKTVIFVSHNIGAISSLCPQSLLLDAGKLIDYGDTPKIVSLYLQNSYSDSACKMYSPIPEKRAQILQVTIMKEDKIPSTTFNIGQEPILEISYIVNEKIAGCQIVCYLYSADGYHIFTSADTDLQPSRFSTRDIGTFLTSLRLPIAFLNSGKYYVNIGIRIPKVEMLDYQEVFSFQVNDNSGFSSHLDGGNRAGILLVQTPWKDLLHDE